MKKRGELAAKIAQYRAMRGVSNEELAAAMRMSTKTLYTRLNNEDFRVSELRCAKRKLKIPDGELVI